MAAVSLDMRPVIWLHLPPVTDAEGPAGSFGDTDEELLARVGAGDHTVAIAALYDRFAGRIYGLGRHQLGTPSLAEELVQETFIKLWRGAPRFDAARGTAATFIFTIARRQAIDLFRRAASRPAEDAEPGDSAVPNDVDRLLLGLAIREAVGGLSADHQEVIRLAHDDGLTQAEIAARLGIPIGTVKTRTYHALRALRSALQRRGIGD